LRSMRLRGLGGQNRKAESLQIPPKLFDRLKSYAPNSGGARLLTGGKRIPGPGNFFEATVLADVPKSCAMYYEEIFGPVAMLFRAKDIDQAIEIANDSDFGLGSSVWTNDEAERARFIADIESGSVFVNGMVASDPRLPFGGVKNSGYGRELSEFGIREFCNIKTVWIK